MFIFRLTEKIFVKPCLWINNHFFHFKYYATSWLLFSIRLLTEVIEISIKRYLIFLQ
jgi:hypothetical protein